MAKGGEQAAATRERILDVAQTLLADPGADPTLEAVAREAGVSVQTVLRGFGSKQGLVVAAIGTVRGTEQGLTDDPPRNEADSVRRIHDDYELIGDRVLRMLADEHRIAGFAEAAAEGRTRHREWVRVSFAAQLRKLPARRRAQAITALCAATDVYVWKLLRRDLGLSRPAAQAVTERLVRGALLDSWEQ